MMLPVMLGIVLGLATVLLLGYVMSWNTNRCFRGPQTRGERLIERVLPYRPQAERDAFERRWHEEQRDRRQP